MMTEAQKRIWESHRWEDTSYHGSPTYECKLCGVREYSEEAKQFCPKLAETLQREAEQQEKTERQEYEIMVAQKKRFEYLHSKYGTN